MFFFGCSQQKTYEQGWMDDPNVLDPSLDAMPEYLVSNRDVTTISTSNPVIIAVHGFTASTYEWQDFLEYVHPNFDSNQGATSNPNKNVYVSLVLLGGHGRSVTDFRGSLWSEWGKPILDEYNTLVSMGFSNISILGASTAGTLILEHLSNSAFSSELKHVFFIDSLIVPRDKLLHLVPYVYFLIGDQKNDSSTDDEKKHWYQIKPKEALRELETLIDRVKQKLEKTITLPEGTVAHVFQSKQDPVVDPISAYLIYKGLKTASGSSINVTPVESSLHVFTRLSGRAIQTLDDQETQQETFSTIINTITQ